MKLVCYGSAQSKLPFVPKNDVTNSISVQSTRRYPHVNLNYSTRVLDYHTRKNSKLIINPSHNTTARSRVSFIEQAYVGYSY